MGLAPLTGVPLPFVSYGNSSLLATLFAVGLILNVARGGTARAGKLRVVEGGRCSSPRKEPIEQCQTAARVVVAAGGTAGHVVPAMAVADELRASGAEVSFLGTRERIEAELVPAAGYEIDFIKVRGIDRRNPLRGRRRRARGARRGAAPPAGAARARGRRGDGRRRLRRRAGRARRGDDAAPRSSSPRPTATSASPTGCSPAARRARLPRLPDRRARGRPLPGHRPAGSRRRAGGRPRRRPRRASASPPTTSACW